MSKKNTKGLGLEELEAEYPNGIPSAIRKQMEEMDELLETTEEEGEPSESEDPEDIQPDDESDDTENFEDLLDDIEAEDTLPDDDGDDSNVTEDEPKQKEENAEFWKNKYNVLKGKYNSEVPGLAKRVNELMAQVSDLSSKLSEYQDKPNDNGNGTDIDDIDPTEFSEYGPEFEKSAKHQKNLSDRLKKLEQQIGNGGQQESTTGSFSERLESACPNWSIQNEDNKFVGWLYSEGKINSLTKAYNDGDAVRCAEIFNQYRKESGNSYHYGPIDDDEASSEKKKDDIPDTVKNQANPSRRGGGAAPSKRTYTVAEVEKFKNDFTSGRYKGREKAAEKLMNDIELAYEEGRITG
jgi:hypothetical protein